MSTCSTRPGQRSMRAVLAVLVSGFAYSGWTAGRLWCAIPATVCATCFAIGAVTGWCPTNLLQRRQPSGPSHGFPDARGIVNLSTAPNGAPPEFPA